MPVKVFASPFNINTTETCYMNCESVIKEECKDGHVEKNNVFCAHCFVDRIHKVADQISCDETNNNFSSSLNLPSYYDEKLYRKGQKFFYKHIFGLFLGKLLGLIVLFSVPFVKILIMTNRSSTALTAYKRYIQTIFHMRIWYDEELKPGSRFWKSIEKVKKMHAAASKNACSLLKIRITQRDMVLAQFGFMGICLVRGKMLGIYDVSDEEWKGFIHLWRVVGHILGIEERFNICRESIDETKQICEIIMKKVLEPYLKNTNKDFDKMSKALIDGMWTMHPILQRDALIYYLYMVFENSQDLNKSRGNGKPLTITALIHLKIIIWFMWASQFTIVRLYLKYIQIMAMWLMRYFPFLAFYKFGKKNSYVTI